MPNTTTMKRKQAKKHLPKKILVVEDEGELGLVLGLVLNDEKFELEYVNNLESADKYLQKEEPSVILLDNQLPGFRGRFYQLYQKEVSFY